VRTSSLQKCQVVYRFCSSRLVNEVVGDNQLVRSSKRLTASAQAGLRCWSCGLCGAGCQNRRPRL